MKANVDHVGIAVQDIDQALAFYRDALGLKRYIREAQGRRCVEQVL
jgi:catechol 2,3-dioxygenase-like lactoylglutathione lyase family enzyme